MVRPDTNPARAPRKLPSSQLFLRFVNPYQAVRRRLRERTAFFVLPLVMPQGRRSIIHLDDWPSWQTRSFVAETDSNRPSRAGGAATWLDIVKSGRNTWLKAQVIRQATLGAHESVLSCAHMRAVYALDNGDRSW